MVSANFAPIHAKCTVLGLGDEGDFLAQIEVSSRLVITTLNFDETDTIILSAETSFVTEDGTIDVQTRSSFILRSYSHDGLLTRELASRKKKIARQEVLIQIVSKRGNNSAACLTSLSFFKL